MFNALFCSNTIGVLSICLIFYSFFIVLCIFCLFYLNTFTTHKILLEQRGFTINKRTIVLILNCFFTYNIILFKSLKFSTSVIFFGHLLLNGLTRGMLMLTLLLVAIVITLLLQSNYINNKILLLQIMACMILCLLLSILWCANTYFAIIFTLDSINLLIVLLLLLDLQIVSRGEMCGNVASKLTGIAVYFWTSFIATILFFIGGLFLLEYFFTVNISVTLLFTTFINSTLFINYSYFNTYVFFLILGFFVKAGLGPFFIWKRYTFNSMRLNTLVVYMFYYFALLFMYIIYIMLLIFEVSALSILGLLIISIILTVVWVSIVFDTSVRLSDFFVMSTLFNTTLVLCAVAALVF